MRKMKKPGTEGREPSRTKQNTHGQSPSPGRTTALAAHKRSEAKKAAEGVHSDGTPKTGGPRS